MMMTRKKAYNSARVTPTRLVNHERHVTIVARVYRESQSCRQSTVGERVAPDLVRNLDLAAEAVRHSTPVVPVPLRVEEDRAEDAIKRRSHRHGV